MLKGGLLPSPIIIPLSSNSSASKNKIDTQTFIEIRSDVSNVRIYFTVDGTKPDPFQIFRTGTASTNLYRGAFRLGQGRRVIKATAVTNDGSRESNVTTKYFNVNDNYSENPEQSSNEYSDEEINQINSFNYSKPDFDRALWNEAFDTSINYDRSNISEDNSYNFLKEPMNEKIIQQNLTHDEEKFWDRKAKPLSPGNGNWKKTLEHIFLNIYNYVKDEQELREIFGWKIFGRIVKTCLIDKGEFYQVVTTFKKPLGEKIHFDEFSVQPIRKKRSKHRKTKRQQTPPIIEDERTSAPKPSNQQRFVSPSPVRQQFLSDEEKQTPRIYTEEIDQQGTLIPYRNFHVERDCENFRKAIKEDENLLINIVGNRSNEQRLKINERYKSHFKQDFDSDIRIKLGEDFREILTNLFYSSVEFDCRELRRALNGLDTNENTLTEILASRSNKHLQTINHFYRKLFDQTLEENILNNINGELKKILILLIKVQRPITNQINEKETEKDAKNLFQSSENKWGSEESKFIQLITNRSDVQLKAIFQTYEKYSNRDIEIDIKSETSGNLRKGLLTIVRVMRNRPRYFAYQLNKALESENCDKNQLNRIVISRCEIDMIQIKQEYKNLMKNSLEKDIKNNTNGLYRDILLELIKDPDEHEYEKEKPSVSSKDEIIQNGTMIPVKNFDSLRDAEALRKAMKGAGTDEQTLIDILGNRDTNQRLEIKSTYKTKLNRDLINDLKSDTSGNFWKLLERLMMNPVELDCFELKQAVKGSGTDEEVLIEILANRNNQTINEINEKYQTMYSKSLEKDFKSDISAEFRRLLIKLLEGNRPNSDDVNKERAKRDAQSLIDAGSSKFRTDNSRFNSLFSDRSDAQLKEIFEQFSELNGKSIDEVIKTETNGDHQRGLLTLIRCIRSRPHFFAEQLNSAMKGFGTKEATLNRIILTRSEIDLLQIKQAFRNLFNHDLERDVSSNTSGDHKKLLLEILKDPSQRNKN